MATTAPGILLFNVDITCIMHALQVKTQLFSFHTYSTLNAHQTSSAILSFTHP